MSPDELVVVRRAYARQMLGLAGVEDASLERAFRTVPRERFLGEAPWRIVRVPGGLRPLPSNDPVYAYQDVLFALAPERGVNNGSPALHARMLHALDVFPGAQVVHIGAGTGYYTALLAELVGEAGRVTAVEVDPLLAEAARANLAPWRNVAVLCDDGARWPAGPADRVYVSFGVEAPAAAWIEQLTPDGRLLFPLGVPAPSAQGPRHSQYGAALLVARSAGGLAARFVCPAYFVFAEGVLAADAPTRAALAAAFTRGGLERIRSLRWQQPADPERCWFWSPKWSLSFENGAAGD